MRADAAGRQLLVFNPAAVAGFDQLYLLGHSSSNLPGSLEGSLVS